MEKRQKTRNKRRKKNSLETSYLNSGEADADAILAMLLAAASKFPDHPKYSASLIKLCSQKLHPVVLENSNQMFPAPFLLSLLPLLLNCSCAKVVCCGAELAGLASLASYQINRQIALDTYTVKGLVSAFRTFKTPPVLSAVCNAFMDLSTTPIGRQMLLHSNVLDLLIFKFLQIPKASRLAVCSCTSEDGNISCFRIGQKENQLPSLLLKATLILINSCDIQPVGKIPSKLLENLFIYLKELWAKVRHLMLFPEVLKSSEQRQFYATSITTCNLAESVFRLSIATSPPYEPFPYEVAKRSIFGTNDSAFRNFMLNYWETSPTLIDRASMCCNEEHSILSSFLYSLNSKPTDPSFLSTMLQSMVSCIPIASDELNIFSFLKEVKSRLGCPLIYHQDIRVLQTERQLQREVHFFQEREKIASIESPLFLGIDNIMKCEEACREGYTIALRGMEFRFKHVASFAMGLASLFGQPSAGANLYLTPSNSQGLMRHYDDHCVFVCQLFGSKHWKLFPKQKMQLPRLYEFQGASYCSGFEISNSECMQVSLREGDILYIPRGCPHEACTDNSEVEGSTGYSLHLTLGIEVEPPFEWEGFAHIALCCWKIKQKQFCYASDECLSAILESASCNLLHVAIGLLENSDPKFRKACLVAANFPSETYSWLNASQRTLFGHIINKIDRESSFRDVLDAVERAAQKKEDLFYRISWLQHLFPDGEDSQGRYWGTFFMRTGKLWHICSEYKDEVETKFLGAKSKFCKEVQIEDAIESFNSLLQKYREVREQYMKGMLSLHCN